MLCFYCSHRPIVTNFSHLAEVAGRDFLGGLVAFFLVAYSWLSHGFRSGGGLAKFSRLAAG